ncbi:MAG: SprT family zinc-dependent metalloprotease [Patescibacteria group bacterium]
MSFVQRIHSYFSAGGESAPYEIVVSARSHHVRLRVSAENGLRVTIPKRFPLREVEKILREKSKWIFQKMKEMERFQNVGDAAKMRFLDEFLTIQFCFPDEKNLSFLKKGRVSGRALKTRRVERHGDILSIFSDDFSVRVVKSLIRDWLRKQAQEIFSVKLPGISRTIGIPFARFSIRGQKTRWGSASIRKTISLNYKLLCAPAFVAEYVMVHELCHLVHMNHSRAFWALVGSHAPRFREARKWLHTEGKYISF